MKVIDDSLTVLPQSAANIGAALRDAATTVAEQGAGFAQDVAGCGEALGQGMAALCEQLAALPGLLDPAPIVASCTAAYDTAAADLRRLADAAAEIPGRLLQQAADVQPVIGSAMQAVDACGNLLPSLAALAPDVQPQVALFNSVPGRGQALVALARNSAGILERYGTGLAALPAQAMQQAEALRGDSLAQLTALRGSLDADIGALQALVADSAEQGSGVLRGVSGLIRNQSATMLAPVQAQVDYVDGIGAALTREGAACAALFDDGAAQLGRLGELLTEPLGQARAQADQVLARLQAIAGDVDTLLQKVLEPLDALDARLKLVAEALRKVAATIRAEVTRIQALLAELDAAVAQAMATLETLPAYLDPVCAMIADANALIDDIAARIPSFVAAAEAALDSAAAEMDQAEDLCDNAITICTRYMMRSPPLMAARVLFVGVKAMVPGVKATIAAARTAVRAAGKQAGALMQQAVALVQALNPVLDQAIEQLKAAIALLNEQMEKLRGALQQVGAALEQIPPEIDTRIDAAAAAAEAVVAQVRSGAQACLEQMQCQPQVARVREQLTDLFDRTLDDIEARIDAAATPVRDAVMQGKSTMQQAVAAASDGLAQVSNALRDVQTQAQRYPEQLAAEVDGWQPRLQTMCATAQQRVREAGDGVLAQIDGAARAIAGISWSGVATALLPPGQLETITGALQELGTRSGVALLLAAPGGVADWQQKVQQSGEQLRSAWSARCEQGAELARQALAQVQDAADTMQDQVAQARAAVPDAATIGEQINGAMDAMRQQTDAVLSQAQSALTDLQHTVEQARTDAEAVGADFAAASEDLMADVEAVKDDAMATAEQAQQAADTVDANIAEASAQVNASVADALAQTTALKDEAQAGCDAAMVEVQAVQAQVNAARADVISAEAIVDAAVAEQGGVAAGAAAEAATAAAAAGTTAAAATSPATGETAAAADAPAASPDAPASAPGAAPSAPTAAAPASATATETETETARTSAPATETASASSSASVPAPATPASAATSTAAAPQSGTPPTSESAPPVVAPEASTPAAPATEDAAASDVEEASASSTSTAAMPTAAPIPAAAKEPPPRGAANPLPATERAQSPIFPTEHADSLPILDAAVQPADHTAAVTDAIKPARKPKPAFPDLPDEPQPEAPDQKGLLARLAEQAQAKTRTTADTP